MIDYKKLEKAINLIDRYAKQKDILMDIIIIINRSNDTYPHAFEVKRNDNHEYSLCELPFKEGETCEHMQSYDFGKENKGIIIVTSLNRNLNIYLKYGKFLVREITCIG